MYCSTCGAHVPAGHSHCTACGAWVATAGGPAAHHAPAPMGRPAPGHLPVAATSHTCHRCGYTGEGVSYFSKGSHIAGLVMLGLVSAGIMGVFALVYYLSFRDHVICPRCGKDWGSHRDLALVPGQAGGGALPAGAPGQPALPVGRGGAAHGFSLALFALAAILVIVGVAAFEFAPIIFGAAAGGGGFLLQNAARREREARRAALIASLQMPVLKLAAERRGRLTVTETAAALGWPLPRAEKVLDSLDDGLRVNSEVTDEGVIVYEFRELSHGRGRPLPPPTA
ncbi:MAG TPA: hypothetical protein VHG51_20935 [Longimicrobiaceae bacterium]|nr:hypothetical protein [Longimicrobiaceae bacterium]